MPYTIALYDGGGDGRLWTDALFLQFSPHLENNLQSIKKKIKIKNQLLCVHRIPRNFLLGGVWQDITCHVHTRWYDHRFRVGPVGVVVDEIRSLLKPRLRL